MALLTIVADPMSDMNGSEIVSDFCFAALSHRKKCWEGELLGRQNDPIGDLSREIRNLFI
jgi:hypothetical protein